MAVFQGLPDQALLRILTAGVRQAERQGTVLMRTDDVADCFYLIIEGRVEVRDREGVPLTTLDSSNVVGEMGLFAPDFKRNADVVVIRDAVLVHGTKLPHQLPRAGTDPALESRLRLTST